MKNELYYYILRYRWVNKGVAPSLREMKAHLKQSGGTVLDELRALHDAGLIELKVSNGTAVTRYIAVPGAQWRLCASPSIELTDEQSLIWRAIVAYKTVHNGIPPTQTSLAAMLGLDQSTVSYHLASLTEIGAIKNRDQCVGYRRYYSLVGESWWHPDLSPLVLAEKMPPQDKGQYGIPQWRYEHRYEKKKRPELKYKGLKYKGREAKLEFLQDVAVGGVFTAKDLKEALPPSLGENYADSLIKLGLRAEAIKRMKRGHYRIRSASYASAR